MKWIDVYQEVSRDYDGTIIKTYEATVGVYDGYVETVLEDTFAQTPISICRVVKDRLVPVTKRIRFNKLKRGLRNGKFCFVR